jgi:acetylornithine/succinyldiaminopimelate/putrescine aminotransferase
VANYVVERLSDPAMLAHVRELGAWFGAQLEELVLNTGGRIRQVRGVGLMWGIDVSGTAAHVVSEAAEQGLLLCTAGEYTVRILPPLVVTKEELTLGLRILEDIL